MFWALSSNAGDCVGPYLYHKITGKYPLYADPETAVPHYLTCGSILRFANNNSTVWGSGIIVRDDVIPRGVKYCAVRGPISRNRILETGCDCPSIYGDPALLMPLFYAPKYRRPFGIGIIPHFIDHCFVEGLRGNKMMDRFKLINICAPIETVIDEITGCEVVLSSSLHGLIFADAYGVPSVWIKLTDRLAGDGVKFKDYGMSVGRNLEAPIDLSQGIDDSIFDTAKIATPSKPFNPAPLYHACPFLP